MAKIFKIGDIKAGYLLRFWDGERKREFNMTVVPQRGARGPFLMKMMSQTVKDTADGDLACCGGGEYWPLNVLSDDLTTASGRFRCTAVYGYTAPRFLLDNSTNMRELLWERGATDETGTGEGKAEPVVMTLDEISAALGYPVRLAEDATAAEVL